MELLVGYLQQGLSALIPFVILLGLLIFVHELGHFLVAKYYGVRVEVFSLGFGKKILQFKRGYTTYAISLVPLGGYVKMFGDDPTQELPPEDQKQSFLHKPVGQRIAIVLAGPLMNFFFAILLFFAVAMIGEEQPEAVVGNVPPKSGAYFAGFEPGDHILAVNSNEIQGWGEFQDFIINSPNTNLEIQLRRNDEVITIQVTPKLADNENPLSTKRQIGQIEGLTFLDDAPVVGVFDLNSPAGRAGFKSGDLITKVNNEEIKYWRDLHQFTSAFEGSQPITFEVLRGTQGERLNIQVNPTNGVHGGELSPIMSEISQGVGPSFFAENPLETYLLYTLAGLGLEAPHLYLHEVVRDSPAAQAGLKKGDRLVAINTTYLRGWQDVLEKVSGFDKDQEELQFVFLRGDELKTTTLAPQMTAHMTRRGTEERRFTVGIRPYTQFAPPPTYLSKTTNPIAGVMRGVERTWDITVMVSISLVRLVTGEISHKNLGGVISIGQVASQTYQIGITHFLQMMAVISINLFILNLLPIPILDGGHLVFFTIEAIRGAPLSLQKMAIAQHVGLILLMTLMVFALFNDISRFFSPF